jgi:glycerophosphoryl diester phosphodiesterase
MTKSTMGLALLLAAGLMSVTPPAMGGTTPRPQVAAHRGDGFSESLDSYIRAIDLGTDYIDADVSVASDGGLFLCHEPAAVSDKTTPWLKAHGFTSLSDLVTATRSSGVKAFLEIKAAQEDTYRRLYAQVQRFGVSKVTLASYHRTRLSGYRKVAGSSAKLSLIIARQQSMDYIRAYQSITLNYLDLTLEYVAKVHAQGMPVYTYTPNDPAGWEKASSADVIITDDLPGYLTWAGR